jgi:hypothetical protein
MTNRKKAVRRTAVRALVAGGADVVGTAVLGVPGVGSAATAVIQSVLDLRQAKADDFVGELVENVGEDAIRAAIERDPEREALFWTATQAVMASGLESKRIYLARVVANALTSDELADSDQLVVTALSELDGIHVRALTRLRAAEDEQKSNHGANDDIFQKALRDEASSVLATLARTGVVYQGTVQDGDTGLYSIPDPRTYSITSVNEFGRYLLNELESVDISDSQSS